MPLSKNLVKVFQNLMRQMMKLSRAITKGLMNWLLRTFLVLLRRQSRLAQEGFVLPTVIMVTLVVVLLTTALVLRSFDRSQTASSGRLDQIIQNSSTPAIDRGRAKIDALLADPNLPRGTPSDAVLMSVMKDAKYTLGDETRLKVAYDFGDGTNGTISNPAGAKPGDPTRFSTADGTIEAEPTILNDETLTTVWKYPVDTDGNGLFDSYTLYGIYWRSPSRSNNGNLTQFNRGRNPLEGRSVPQESTGLSKFCKAAGLTSATTVAGSDWYKIGANLAKSFYVYGATVPIPNLIDLHPGPFANAQFEPYTKASKAFSGLEYEQDSYRTGINNSAVAFENDLILSPGSDFRVNGKVTTNGNLLVGSNSANIQFFQVSSRFSCFYEEDNSKITVGGNVGDNTINQNQDAGKPTNVDLYNGFGVGGGSSTNNQKQINSSNKSTNSAGGSDIAYNDAAYEQRIALMKGAALSYCSNCITVATQLINSTLSFPPTQYPKDLQTSITTALAANTSNLDPVNDILPDQIEIYLRNRTRRVPYTEIPSPDGTGATSGFTSGSVFSGTVEVPQVWREPTDANTKLSLNEANLLQTQPELETQNGLETLLGDRVNVGNNLPALWKDTTTGQYIGQNQEPQPYPDGTKWTNPADQPRSRISQVQALADLGVSDRNGYWETAAALDPAQRASQGVTGGGGLRVITGAGIYVDDNGLSNDTPVYPRSTTTPNSSFLPGISSGSTAWDLQYVDPTGQDTTKLNPINDASTTTPGNSAYPRTILQYNNQPNLLVWPDTMPMTGGTNEQSGQNRKGDLLMRATAVYHYVDAARANQDVNQLPIACVSSYYDPTNATTARNPTTLADVSGEGANSGGAGVDGGRSNNGIVYSFPETATSRNITAYLTTLERQARLAFPNGRLVNKPLRDALTEYRANAFTKFQLADYSAIDTAICAIAILNGTATRSTAFIPDGAIKEASFLDAREVKAIDTLLPNDSGYDITKNYNLPLEQRQPSEIRVTDINLGVLAQTTHGTYDAEGDGIQQQEYLLPNSGIIYASRDDALPDITSSGTLNLNPTDPQFKLSSASGTDFKMDPTRRPNGIRLINGFRLARGTSPLNTYTKEEKGLILVTDLPVYVKGHLNLHLESGTSLPTGTSIPTELEEFSMPLNSTWGNFYDRGDNNGGGLESRFACRPGQSTLCTGQGDQWRPASIIADAVTLQSVNFKDGTRDLGDFDLRNNAGSLLAGAWIGNGFFDNNFVTSAPWWDTSSSGPVKPWSSSSTNASQAQASYLLNGVTPIQRRAKVVAFSTETCKKIPLSDCTATDWASDGFNTSSLPAGAADQRYARRVAFLRSSSNQYFYDSYGFPIAIDSAGKNVLSTNDNSAYTPPATIDNALWFRTRPSNISIDQQWNAGTSNIQNDRYDGQQNLFIFQPPEALKLGVELGVLRHYLALDSTGKYAAFDSSSTITAATTTWAVLKDATNFSTSDKQNITPIYNNLRNLATNTNANTITSTDIKIDDYNYKTQQLAGGGKLGIFNYTGSLNSTSASPIKLTGDAGSIFVIIVSGALSIDDPRVNNIVNLNGGVVAENVYWVVNGNVTVGAKGTLKGNVLSGTLISINGTLQGRAFAQNVNLSANIQAPDGNQPRLVPVLQIHSPSGPTQATLQYVNSGDYKTFWLQQAQNTNYNAAFAVGNSPDRPTEESAGLHNFVRFQENWSTGSSAQTATIKGSFIQPKRSAYATAPFASTLATGAAGNPQDITLSLFNYNPSGYQASNNPEPYYVAPTRQWGFDVGLLSQLPDLYSQRFSNSISKRRDYYREVGKDDLWIKTLLCAAEPNSPTPNQLAGQAGTPYDHYVVQASERPKEGCNAVVLGKTGTPDTQPDYHQNQL